MINPNNTMKNEEEDMMSDTTTTNTNTAIINSSGNSSNSSNNNGGNGGSGGGGGINLNLPQSPKPSQLNPIHLNFPTVPVISYPSLPSMNHSLPTTVNNHLTGNLGSTTTGGGAANRFSPYTTANANFTFQEKWDLVEQVISMFPLLEKDPVVYSTLQKNAWVVENCVNEFQKRHEILEKRAKRKEEKVKNLTEPLLKQKLTESNEMHDIIGIGEEEEEDDELLDDESYEDGSGPIRRLNSSDNNIDEEILDEENDDKLDSGSSQDLMMDGRPIQPSSDLNSQKTALSFSRFPHLKEHIQTLRDIFGTTYHEYELKSFYVACNGNLELVIDQIVNDQIKLNAAKAADQKNSNNGGVISVDGSLNQPQLQVNQSEKKPLTERLSEEEKRAIQIQLIEEQEKLEKKFSEQKKNEIKNHPSKKNFTQQEMIDELKDLFGKSVDDGVIEWVAYRCDYDLGNAVTQLVDIKHNSLLKKGTINPPTIDQNTQNLISQNLEILAKKNLANAGINLDSFADEISKKLTAVDHNDINGSPLINSNSNSNSGMPPKNIFFNGLTTTTTTNSSSNNNSPPNNNNNVQNSNSINPFFQTTFNYNSGNNKP